MSSLSKSSQAVGLIGWLLLSYAAAAVGASASVQSQALYSELTQPAWAPPGWVFGPVWTLLYTLMGVAAWLVWREGGLAAHRGALGWFGAQLVANALWTWLFFAWRRGGLALADIVLLGGLIAATLVSFWRVRPLAGALLVPYLLWVTFAGALNYALWQLNPGTLGQL